MGVGAGVLVYWFWGFLYIYALRYPYWRCARLFMRMESLHVIDMNASHVLDS
jgi:hypothetical protein